MFLLRPRAAIFMNVNHRALDQHSSTFSNSLSPPCSRSSIPHHSPSVVSLARCTLFSARSNQSIFKSIAPSKHMYKHLELALAIEFDREFEFQLLVGARMRRRLSRKLKKIENRN